MDQKIYTNATGSWRSSNSTDDLRLTKENSTFNNSCTLNTNYTVDSGNVTTTLDLSGRNISWRYNSDNTWDLFDEDTDEVVISGDDNLDGSDMYPYLLSVNNSTEPLQDYVQYEWDWNENGSLNIVTGNLDILRHLLVDLRSTTEDFQTSRTS